MSKERTLKQWIAAYNRGKFEDKNVSVQVEAGWYDWFCKDSSLAGKTRRMGNIVKQLKDSSKVNLDTMYVWFKNNCPLVGPLYDDFRIADIESGDVLFTIKVNDLREEKRYVVYGRKNDFMEPLFETDNSRELIKWFNEEEKRKWEKVI